MKKILCTVILMFVALLPLQAQNASESTIDSKFTELMDSSNNYKGYKVVDREELSKLKELTSQRIAQLKAEIVEANKAALAQKQQMDSLENQLEDLQKQLAEVTAEKDAITFLGMPITKAVYKSTMWGVIGVLLLALAFFIYQYKRSHVHTKEARKSLAETEKEFEAFRSKSLEKEQRLGRLLQDEKNKQMKMAK